MNFEYEKTLRFPAETIAKLPKLEDTPNADGGASSIAVSKLGRIFVTDEVSNAIAVLDSELNIINSISFGESDFAPDMPRQIALWQEEVFIADSANSRIQVFDEDLKPKKSVSERLIMPVGVAVSPSGKLFVLDGGDSRLKTFDSSGKFLEEMGGLGTVESTFYNPEIVRLDSSGKVYVLEEGNSRIQVFDSSLKFLKIVEGIKRTFNVSLTPFYPAISKNGDIAFSDSINNKVFILDSKFELKKILGGRGYGNTHFNTPKGLAFDFAGNLFVSDPGNRRVQVFSPDYSYLRTIKHDKLIWPLAISVSEQGKVFVVDDKHKIVMAFTREGQFIEEIGAENGITLPLGILAQGGKIYITDDLDKTIEVFDSSLRKLETVSGIDERVGQHVEFNESLALDKDGKLLFCDNRNRMVVSYDFSTQRFSTFGNFGSALQELSILEVAAKGNLIVVTDMEHHRIKIFDQSLNELKEITIKDLQKDLS